MDDLIKELLSARSVAFAHELYSKSILPKDASPLQAFVVETSYYAGVDWALRRILAAGIEGERDLENGVILSDEEAVARLTGQFLEETAEHARTYEQKRAAFAAKEN